MQWRTSAKDPSQDTPATPWADTYVDQAYWLGQQNRLKAMVEERVPRSWRAHIEEIAAHQAETGDDIKTTAEKLQFPGVTLKSAQVIGGVVFHKPAPPEGSWGH